MHPLPTAIRTIAPCLLILAVFLAGCEGAPQKAPETGSVQVTSTPPGAEIYFDNEYRGTTPATIASVAAGEHTLEVRERGYERSVRTVTVAKGAVSTIAVVLTKTVTTMPVTIVTTVTPVATKNVPQIHVDGYWTFPPSPATAPPYLLIVHTEGFNVGTADAREVTVIASLSYEGRQVCSDTVYLGTLKAGGHVSTDTMVSCTLPTGFSSPDVTIKFDNVVVTQ